MLADDQLGGIECNEAPHLIAHQNHLFRSQGKFITSLKN